VEIDWDKLERAVRLCVRLLDNVIDANRYSVPEIEQMTKATRKIGLGVMGFADLLVQLRVPYNSEEGISLGRRLMAFIREKADDESISLAKVRGPFPAYEGSRLQQQDVPPIRNSWRLTVAPTGTISMIAGSSSGIEPIFALAYRKHNILEGQTLYYVDPAFDQVARSEGFYSEELMEYISNGGSIQERADIPGWVKDAFVTAPDISPEWHVKMQAAFQESVDAAISKTINFPNSATVEDVRTAYVQAWRLGCKGITVYRAGSREQEVLTAGLSEEARKKKEEEATVAATTPRRPRGRPSVMRGITERLRTGHGNLYVTINFDEESRPFEVFSTQGKAGGCDSAHLEAISRLISLALRSGIPADQVIEQLRGITCCPVWDKGVQIRSNPDAVALALTEHLHGPALSLPNGEPGEAAQRKGTEGAQLGMPLQVQNGNGHNGPALSLPNGRGSGRPEALRASCPECGGKLVFAEGCIRCSECSFNKCE
jgi:ribonucleoside-diphosphate reductase alpha chain